MFTAYSETLHYSSSNIHYNKQDTYNKTVLWVKLPYTNKIHSASQNIATVFQIKIFSLK